MDKKKSEIDRPHMNNSTKTVSFTGGGINASSMFPVMQSGMPYQAFAAPWPLARLMVHKDAVVFHVGYVHKGLSRPDITVVLSKSGYIFFRTSNRDNDFGFGPTKVADVINLLRSFGYHLDESCVRNLRIAQAAQRTWAVLFSILLIFMGVTAYNTGALWFFLGFIAAMTATVGWGTFSSKNGDPHKFLASRGKPRPNDPDDWSTMM